jgi:hypothetical protein
MAKAATTSTNNNRKASKKLVLSKRVKQTPVANIKSVQDKFLTYKDMLSKLQRFQGISSLIDGFQNRDTVHRDYIYMLYREAETKLLKLRKWQNKRVGTCNCLKDAVETRMRIDNPIIDADYTHGNSPSYLDLDDPEIFHKDNLYRTILKLMDIFPRIFRKNPNIKAGTVSHMRIYGQLRRMFVKGLKHGDHAGAKRVMQDMDMFCVWVSLVVLLMMGYKVSVQKKPWGMRVRLVATPIKVVPMVN